MLAIQELLRFLTLQFFPHQYWKSGRGMPTEIFGKRAATFVANLYLNISKRTAKGSEVREWKKNG